MRADRVRNAATGIRTALQPERAVAWAAAYWMPVSRWKSIRARRLSGTRTRRGVSAIPTRNGSTVTV